MLFDSCSCTDKVIPANEAHLLFSSMGFPLDLTQLMAEERGFTVDTKGFEARMEADRKISEEAEQRRKGGDSRDLTMESEQTSYLANQGIKTTDTDAKYVWDSPLQATVKAVYLGRGATGGFVEAASSEGSCAVYPWCNVRWSTV